MPENPLQFSNMLDWVFRKGGWGNPQSRGASHFWGRNRNPVSGAGSGMQNHFMSLTSHCSDPSAHFLLSIVVLMTLHLYIRMLHLTVLVRFLEFPK
jgi:hypothetical protein